QNLRSTAVLPDLMTRAWERAAIVSRVIRTWGLAESTLAEQLQPRIDALDAAGGNPTIAFLASGIEGIKVRITAKAPTSEVAFKMIEAEDAEVRVLLGSIVFGVDDDTVEAGDGGLLEECGLT